MTQNMFSGELHVKVVIETYHEAARRHEILKIARMGQPRRTTGAAFTAAAREWLAAIRRVRLTTSQPSCQPCVAC